MKSASASPSVSQPADVTLCTPAEYVARLDLRVEALFERLSARFDSGEIALLRQAYALARRAHEGQFRKGGEPYIMHPVAVATIIAEDFMMDANSVAAGFLHDVVEDTPTSIEDIRREFGDDVAFLVQVVTKPKSHTPGHPDRAKQENNFRQLLDSMRRDIRAVLIKLADRLHNMRSLGSMQPVKQMKIAGETDFFYAPFANRLGLNNLRRELENLSFRFRCPERYERLRHALEIDRAEQADRLDRLTARIRRLLSEEGIEVRTEVRYRLPYSIDRSMRGTGRDVAHVEHRYVVRVIYDRARLTPLLESAPDKTICLRIYGILTAAFREKAGSLVNYVDHPKENGYRSMHVQLLGEMGTWEEIHISSEEMVRRTKLGIMLERIGNRRADGDVRDANRLLERGDREWIDKFCHLLERIAAGAATFTSWKGWPIRSTPRTSRSTTRPARPPACRNTPRRWIALSSGAKANKLTMRASTAAWPRSSLRSNTATASRSSPIRRRVPAPNGPMRSKPSRPKTISRPISAAKPRPARAAAPSACRCRGRR